MQSFKKDYIHDCLIIIAENHDPEYLSKPKTH